MVAYDIFDHNYLLHTGMYMRGITCRHISGTKCTSCCFELRYQKRCKIDRHYSCPRDNRRNCNDTMFDGSSTIKVFENDWEQDVKLEIKKTYYCTSDKCSFTSNFCDGTKKTTDESDTNIGISHTQGQLFVTREETSHTLQLIFAPNIFSILLNIRKRYFDISDKPMSTIGGHQILMAVIILGFVISLFWALRFVYAYVYTLTFVYVLIYILCGAKNYFVILKKDIKTYNRRKC